MFSIEQNKHIDQQDQQDQTSQTDKTISLNQADQIDQAASFSFKRKLTPSRLFDSWQFIAINVIALVALATWLQKPTGVLEGTIALEKQGFGFYSYDLSKNHVCAIAVGPRGSYEQERGVWINKDGTYKIAGLPVGEYQIKVRATGFDTGYETGLFVDEAATTTAPRIELSAIEPAVSIATVRKVFTTNEAPSFWVNGTGCTNTTVKVYKKNVLDMAEADQKEKKQFINGNDNNNSQLAGIHYGESFGHNFDWSHEVPYQTFTRTFEQTFDQSLSAQFKFDKPLPPGEYWMTVEGRSSMGGETSGTTAWFIVSNLGMIVMRAPEKTVVRAIDLTTLKPIKDASISQGIWTAGRKTDKTILTNAEGFATFSPIAAPAATALGNYWGCQNADTLAFSARLGPHRAYDDVSFWSTERDKYNTYMYTERPVYRLGQTAYFKGIVREKTLDGNKNPGNKLTVSCKVTDEADSEIWHGELHTNEHGTFNGAVVIPEDGHTGRYTIQIEFPDKSTAQESFEIMEYRKPEYLVEVKPESTRVVAGSKMKARVHATYFFGGPVANAKVKYNIYASTDYSMRYKLKPRPDYYSFFDDWDGNDYSGGYGGDFVVEGEALTDANGDAEVSFDTKKIEIDPKDQPSTYDFQDKRYRIEAEVTDISRISVSGTAYETATAGDFELFVTPDSYVAAVGQPLGVKIEAIDYDGKPVANQKLKVNLSRILYDHSTYTTKGSQVVTDITIATGSNGVAHATMEVGSWPSDTFYVSATGQDNHGNKIFNAAGMWIANGLQPYVAREGEEQSQPVTVKLDKPIYQPGDIARMIVTAPVHGNEGVQAIVSVQGRKLYSYKVINMDATAKLVEIPITKEYAPNAFVVVAIVDSKHQFYSQEQELRVSPKSNFLNITIDSDKKKYHPGDKVQYTIKATKDDGTPAKNTELSLSVVDEAIYSVHAETASDIRKTFYTKTDNNVLTSCSFPEDYSGGPDKGGDAPAVRKDFRDIAAWLPSIKTDDKGIAIASITLPDNLTTWRATVRGIDMQTNVGATMQKIMCTQDLILRIALPRFFTQGDEGLVTAVVHNYSDINQNITLTMKTSNNFATKTPLVQKISLQPEKAGRFSWPVSMGTAGIGVINIKAVGQGAGDAVEQKLPIQVLGIPAFSAQAGLMDIDQQSVTLPAKLSGDAIRSTAKFHLNLASSTLGPVIGNFGALIEYPYGCTEQTMSRLIPSVVAMQLHTRLGQPLKAEDKKKFDKVYEKAIEKLAGYRHSDGGWGWWETDDSNVYLTSLVVNGMQLLKEAGYKPDPDWIKGGIKYLNTQDEELFSQMSDPYTVHDWWVNESRTDLAKGLYTQSEFKSYPSKPITSWFAKELDSLCPETLSYMCLTYHNAGENSKAQLFYDRLIELANTSKETMDWQHSRTLINKMHARDKKKSREWFDDYSYRFTAVESTALALRCVLTMEPNNTDRIESIKKWIMLHRDQNGWENTKTTAEVFMVLLQDELQAREKGSGNFTARISFNDKEIETFTANASNLYESQKDIKLAIPESATSLVIEKNGGGRLYYNTMMSYFRSFKRGEHVQEKAMPEGLRIQRKFYRLVAADKASDGGMHFHTEEIKDGKVKAGETILMKVFVDAPCSIPYVQVDAALPSGAEVVEDSSEENNVDQSNASPDESGADKSLTGDWESAWWTHCDVLDNKIVYFGTNLKEGRSTFHKLIRMELPGRIGINPVSLIGSYTDKVRGYSDLDELTVTEEAGK